jgi:predicted lipoprotein with Yx(FWY)xxD motif
MSKRKWLFFAAVVGLVAVEACSDSDTTSYPPATAGGAGKAGAGGHSGNAGHAGTGLVVAGATNEQAGQGGEPTSDAGAGGEAGGSEAGASSGGSGAEGGTLPSGGTGGTGGSAGASNAFTLQSTTLGQVIGTANGLSLYVFNTDTAATSTTPPVSTCTAGCLTNWPIYYGTPVSVPAGLLASDFASFDRGSGVMQSTYKGWPLYTYAPDTAVGDVKGEGVGSKWYTVKLPFTTPGATTFTLQTTTLGPVIATANGLSLYVFTADTVATGSTPPVSACTGGCLGTWPIYYGNPLSVPLGLLASDFGSFDRGSGVMQSTYKGWPLYTYTPDTAVGDVKGEGVNSKWYTAKSPFALP